MIKQLKKVEPQNLTRSLYLKQLQSFMRRFYSILILGICTIFLRFLIIESKEYIAISQLIISYLLLLFAVQNQDSNYTIKYLPTVFTCLSIITLIMSNAMLLTSQTQSKQEMLFINGFSISDVLISLWSLKEIRKQKIKQLYNFEQGH